MLALAPLLLASSALASPAPVRRDTNTGTNTTTCVAPASPDPSQASLCFTHYPTSQTAGEAAFLLEWQADPAQVPPGSTWSLFALLSEGGVQSAQPYASYEHIQEQHLWFAPPPSAGPDTTIHFWLESDDYLPSIFSPAYPVNPSPYQTTSSAVSCAAPTSTATGSASASASAYATAAGSSTVTASA